MSKKNLLLSLSFISLINQVVGQTFKQQFDKLALSNDTVGQRALLVNWEADGRPDPDLYTSYFNFYFLKSQKTITIANKLGSENLTPIDDKLENVGYKQNYDQGDLDKAHSYIDQGIAKFPNRLDMRFGKIYVYGVTEEYEGFSSEIIKMVDYSDKIDNGWLWADNNPLEDADKVFPETLQKYFVQLYRAYLGDKSDTAILGYMENICTTILKYQPDRVVSLSNLALVYMFREDFDKAIPVLLKAEKLAPTEAVILLNLAQVYEQKGDKKRAIKYFERLTEYGGDREKAFAKKQLEKLK